MPTRRVNQTQRKKRKTHITKKRLKGGCIPCLPPVAPLLGLGGLAAGATIISSSSSRAKDGKVQSESETRVMKNKNGRTMSIRVHEKDGDLKVRVGSKSFKTKPGETRDQALHRAIQHCEKRGYKGCSETSNKRKKRKKRSNNRDRIRYNSFRHT